MYLVPLCLVIVVVAVLIRLGSDGPVFFKQKRVGLNGEVFTLYKLRTIHVHHHDSLYRQAIASYISGQKLNDDVTKNISYKLAEDPRVTRIGHFLRKTSLDVLPQFFNVLMVEMDIEYLQQQSLWKDLKLIPLTLPVMLFARSGT